MPRKAIKEIYAQDAERAKAMAAERKKNGTIEMSAAKMATMMDEAGGGEAGGDVPMVKVGQISMHAMQCHATPCHATPPICLFLSTTREHICICCMNVNIYLLP